jgi:hypothetical protein
MSTQIALGGGHCPPILALVLSTSRGWHRLWDDPWIWPVAVVMTVIITFVKDRRGK